MNSHFRAPEKKPAFVSIIRTKADKEAREQAIAAVKDETTSLFTEDKSSSPSNKKSITADAPSPLSKTFNVRHHNFVHQFFATASGFHHKGVHEHATMRVVDHTFFDDPNMKTILRHAWEPMNYDSSEKRLAELPIMKFVLIPLSEGKTVDLLSLAFALENLAICAATVGNLSIYDTQDVELVSLMQGTYEEIRQFIEQDKICKAAIKKAESEVIECLQNSPIPTLNTKEADSIINNLKLFIKGLDKLSPREQCTIAGKVQHI